MTTSRETKTLFNQTSVQASEYSLRFFSFRHQATIQAVGLHPDDEITFEMIHLESGTPDKYCGCFIRPGDMPSIGGVETLLCFACSEDAGTTPKPVVLTADNPVVVLNSPQNVILRARYEGPGLGMSQVWATLETDSETLLPGMDGCLPDCCEHDPDSWMETGEQRCNLEEDVREALMVDNCGDQQWREAGPLEWQDTGPTRCNVTENIVEKQQENQCGDKRWVKERDALWEESGEIKCIDFDIESLEYTVVAEEVSECGAKRWEITRTEQWADTGETRCNRAENIVEKQQQTLCGDKRWVKERDALWELSGEFKCTDFDPDSNDYTVVEEEVSECGVTRWEITRTEQWADNGVFKCNVADDWVEKQQTTLCGNTRWVQDPNPHWQDTGDTRCKDRLVEFEQANACGHTRWMPTEEPCGYVATLPLPCGGVAFRPGDNPPDATVELEAGCEDGEIIGYIYPDPREGADVPVYEGCADQPCGNGELIGYAVNKKIPLCSDNLVRVEPIRVDEMPTLKVEIVNGSGGSAPDSGVTVADIKSLQNQINKLSKRLAVVETEINNAGCV